MKTKISIIYSWFVRLITCFLPNHPTFMRFRGWLYSLMMKECGKNFQITSSAILVSLTGLSFGDNVYVAHNCVFVGTNIKIGDNVLVGPNCTISSGNHTYGNGSYRFGKSSQGIVIIEEGSWVASNCSVVSGAMLPKQSILAAGSVLNKQYTETNALYGGVPAKMLKSGINNSYN